MAAPLDWTFKVVPNFSAQGNKCNLPEECLKPLMDKVDPPFYFEICKHGARMRISAREAREKKEAKTRMHGDRKVDLSDHKAGKNFDATVERIQACGVLEFSAPPKKIVVPKWLMDELHVTQGQSIDLRHVMGVAKGTIVRFQPFKTTFSAMMEHAGSLAPIENAFAAHYSAIRQDTVIQIRGDDGKDYRVHVIETKPQQLIAVNQAQELFLDLHLAKDVKSAKNLKAQLGKALEDIWSSDDEDEDHNPDDEEKVDTRQRPGPSKDNEEKVWDPEEDAMTEEAKLQAIFNHNEAKMPDLKRQGSLLLSEVDAKGGKQRCRTCHQQFPASQLRTHQGPCKMVNMRCPTEDCGVLVVKSDLQNHQRTEHVMVSCECGMDVMKSTMARHHKRFCPCRKRCKFCLEMIRFAEYRSHVVACGDRMFACPKCDAQVKLRSLLDGSHEARCLIPCPDCRARVRALELENHRATTCSERSIQCDICHMTFHNSRYRTHRIGCENRLKEMASYDDNMWACHLCTTRNRQGSTTCSSCGTRKRGSAAGGGNRPRPTPARPANRGPWACNGCTFYNSNANSNTCEVCGTPR